MTGQLYTGAPRATDANGKVISGAKMYFYATGTNTFQTVYADAALTTALSNPVLADAGGRYSTVYLNNALVYRAYETNSSGTPTGLDIDPCSSALSSSSGASSVGATDGAGGAKWSNLQGFVSYLLSSSGASAIGTASGLGIQVDLNNAVSNAVIQATSGAASSATSAANSAAQALAALGIKNNLGTPVTAGGTLPNQVLNITGGGGTGGTPGTYAGLVSGSGFSGFQWQLVVGSNGISAPQILTNGLSTSSTVPTLVMPTVTGLTGATTPSVTVGAIPSGVYFTAPDAANFNTLAWGNNAGVLASAPFGGAQVSTPNSANLAAFKARSVAKPGPSRQVWVDANGYAMAIINKTQINHPDINTIRVNAAAAAAAALPKPRIRIASNHGGWNAIGVSQSNGTTQLTGTDRLAFTVGGAVRAPRFILANGYEDPSGQLNPNGNALSLAMVLEQAPQLGSVSVGSVTATPISSGGKSTHVIGDGEIVISEPIAYGQLTAGNVYYYRIHKSVASGQKWPLTLASINRSWQPGGATLKTTDVVYGSSGTGADATASYGATTQNFVTMAYAFAPIAIVAEQVSLFATTLVTGDSISGGTGSTIGQGYIGAALDAVSGTYVNCGVAGVSLQNLSLFGRVPQYVVQFVDHVVIHCLTNDLYLGMVPTLASAQALILKAAQAFFRPDGKLWFCTILPRTTSTDTWATYANQATNATVPSGATLTIEQLRVTINNNMRDTTATGLIAYLVANGIPAARIGGIIDGAALIEHNSDGSLVVLGVNSQQTLGTGGYYLINATPDGIHPNGTGVTALTPAVPTTALTSIPVN